MTSKSFLLMNSTDVMVNECPLCRASAADGLSCSGCVKNNLYYKQQAIAYKKMSLRDAYEQAKSVLTTNQPVFREQQALAALMRRQGELKTRLQEVIRRGTGHPFIFFLFGPDPMAPSHTNVSPYIFFHSYIQTAERVRDLRLAVARKTFALEERRKAVDVARQRLEEVKRWQGSQSTPVQQGLRWYKEQAMEVVQQRVWTRVLEHFVVFPIEADIPVVSRPPLLLPSRFPPLLPSRPPLLPVHSPPFHSSPSPGSRSPSTDVPTLPASSHSQHVPGKGTQEQAPAFIPPPCPPSRASAGPKPLTGVSTIVGLPLPNAGNYRGTLCSAARQRSAPSALADPWCPLRRLDRPICLLASLLDSASCRVHPSPFPLPPHLPSFVRATTQA